MYLSPEEYILIGETLAEVAAELKMPSSRNAILQPNKVGAIEIKDRVSLIMILERATVLSGVINGVSREEIMSVVGNNSTASLMISVTQNVVGGENQFKSGAIRKGDSKDFYDDEYENGNS